MLKRLLVTFAIVLPVLLQTVQASQSINEAVRQVNQQMQLRQQRIDDNLAQLEKLKITILPIKRPTIADYLKPTGRALPCLKKMFSWPGKYPEYLYEDCEFKMNIANTDDIDAMYAMLQQRKLDGWVVERTETLKQDLFSDKKHISIERYRFKKLKEEG